MNREKRKVINRNLPIALATTIVLALLILTSNSAVLAHFGGAVNFPQTYVTNNNQSPQPGTTDIIGAATMDGRFITNVTAASVDGKCSINILRGTTGFTVDMQPLTQINITPTIKPLPLPKSSAFIGLTYELSPEGATFDPPITISFTYDPNKIPAGVNEKDFAVAGYDKATRKWGKLSNNNVDPVKHIIRGEISIFTSYSIIAYTASKAPTSETQTNWGLIGGLITAVVVIITLLIFFLWRRRRLT